MFAIAFNWKWWGILSLCPLVALSATVTVRDSERLLQEGHAAFARGDYAGAAALYEQAETYSTEPARAAFYLAGAKYRLAASIEGPSPELREADKLYRCCLDPRNERRAHALYGLGNCLLREAGVRDAAVLRTAIVCYDRCLQSAGDDEALSADARYNREKARLLLRQFQPPPRGAQGDKPPNEGENPYSPRPDQRHGFQMSLGEHGSEDGTGTQAAEDAVKPNEGTAATKSNDPPSPGKGNLPPVPDEVDVPPLSPRDASEHLEMATRKVLHERQTFHRRGERASAPDVKDW